MAGFPSEPGRHGLATVPDEQFVGETRCFKAAGFVGWTLGVMPPQRWPGIFRRLVRTI